MTTSGTCTIRASQGGDARYAPATPVDKSFIIAAATHSVTYNLNGGRYDDSKLTPGQTLVAQGTVFKVAKIEYLAKTGYTFGGWSDSSKIYAGGASYTMGNVDVVFTATWIPKQFEITWNIKTNGGVSGGKPGAVKYTVGTAMGALASNAVRTGKVFKGWYTLAIGGIKITSAYVVPTPFGAVVFYAQFL